MKQTLRETLPAEYVDGAYSSNGEFAWPKEEALKVIEHLTRASWAVLWVEVWLPTSGGPTVPGQGVYTWDPCLREETETWAAFVHRNNQAASAFISRFAWSPEDGADAEPVFNIEAISLQEWERLPPPRDFGL